MEWLVGLVRLMLLAVVVLVLVSQVLIPLVLGRQFFPIFRRKVVEIDERAEQCIQDAIKCTNETIKDRPPCDTNDGTYP
jgi:hypothetical protein